MPKISSFGELQAGDRFHFLASGSGINPWGGICYMKINRPPGDLTSAFWMPNAVKLSDGSICCFRDAMLVLKIE